MANYAQATYNLNTIQQMIKNSNYFITLNASNSAVSLGMNDHDIVNAVLRLDLNNFYKSMQSTKIATLWQDVYHMEYMNKTMYIKLQITVSSVVISFKEK